MSLINGVLARVFVDDLDAAVPFYQRLAGGAEPRRFASGGVQLAWIGPFLLLSGDTAAYRDRVATLLVADLAPIVAELAAGGGQVVEGPSAAPNGRRMIARHPDGSIFEYIETR